MADRPWKQCCKPGCFELTRGRYCVKHQAEFEEKQLARRQQYDKDRGRESASKRGYDRAWRIVKMKHLRRHPLCNRCGSHKELEVHHIIPIEEGGARLDMKNLETLCKPCHDKHHGRKA